jgi:hypothetical protein
MTPEEIAKQRAWEATYKKQIEENGGKPPDATPIKRTGHCVRCHAETHAGQQSCPSCGYVFRQSDNSFLTGLVLFDIFSRRH